MDYFMSRVMLSVSLGCNLLRCGGNVSNSKTVHLWIVKVFSGNCTCNQYTHSDNITLKVFSNINQRSKAHFLVITHWGANAILEVNPQQTIIDGPAGCSLFCGQTFHSSRDQAFTQGTATQRGEGHKQHLKEPCKGLRSKKKSFYHTHTHTHGPA